MYLDTERQNNMANPQPCLHSEKYPNRVYSNPVDYFKNDPKVSESPITKPIFYFLAGFTGAGSAIWYNHANRRPFLSGFQYHIGLTALGLIAAHYAYKNREKHTSTRDAMYRHYIELHPEDFPPIERKQFRDILRPWYPVR